MKKVNHDYHVSRHTCYLLQYHMVFVTKYRKPVLQGDVRDYVYSLIANSLKTRGCKLIDIHGEPDHVHILFEAGPEMSLVETANVLKTRTARMTRKRYPEEMKKCFWGDKPLFWSASYFVTTVGYNNCEAIARYIQNQGQD